MSNSVVDSPPQLPAAGAWGSLYGVQEPVKPHHVSVSLVPAAAKKKPVYGVKRNLEMCTEALGCETGGVDTTTFDVEDGAARKRHARGEHDEDGKEEEEPTVERRVRVLPPPLTTLATGMRMVHERRDGRLEVYAVRASGMEAERSGGRLRLRFHPCSACKCNAAACSQQEPRRLIGSSRRLIGSSRRRRKRMGTRSTCAVVGAWRRKVLQRRQGAARNGSRSRRPRSG